MKSTILSLPLLFFLFLQFCSFGQSSIIQKLETELSEVEGSRYCEKALLLSELYLGNKDYKKATEYATAAYDEANRLGRKDYMATALNRQAKAKLKNKNLRKIERLAALKQLGKSLEVMTAYGIENIELETDNIESLVDAGKEFIGKADKEDFEEILVLTFDSIKFDLTTLPDAVIRVDVLNQEAPNSAVPEHIIKKREQQHEFQHKIMEMNLAHTESEIKKAKIITTTTANATAPSAIEDFVNLPELKELWKPQKEELENDFNRKAKRIDQMDAMEAKEELLLAEYKNKYDSLSHIHTVDSINLEKKGLALQQQKAEVARQKIQRSLMMVGSGGSVILSLLFLFGFVQQRKNNRLLSQKNTEIQQEQDRSQELLLNILPSSVASELKQYGAAKAQRYDEVSVLFSDFQNFSKIAEKLSPEKLIQELDYCFKAFDRITEKFQLEKIKTIGDAYLCAGGIPSPHPEHATRSINAGMEMQAFLEQWKKEKIEKGEVFFEARIGIHTGPIIAGVVGVKKFAYDIWGDTVNIASRMESSGQVGKVNISEKTHALVENQFNFVERGKIEIKNKGEVNMYFVEAQPVTV